MKYIVSILLTLAILVLPASSLVVAPTASAQGYSGFPTISIVSVVADEAVTFRAQNLPPNDTFNVLMNYMGTRGRNGWRVASFDTGRGGNQTYTVDIPSQLEGEYQIAIRIQSPTSRYFAYNWFYNSTAGGGTGGGGTTTGYRGFPRTQIVSVSRNESVTVRFTNLPPRDEFRVTMGRIGTRGVNGIKVGTIDTQAGDTQTLTFNIPEALQGQARIAIRIESKTGSGYFAYDWFYNRDAE